MQCRNPFCGHFLSLMPGPEYKKNTPWNLHKVNNSREVQKLTKTNLYNFRKSTWIFESHTCQYLSINVDAFDIQSINKF